MFLIHSLLKEIIKEPMVKTLSFLLGFVIISCNPTAYDEEKLKPDLEAYIELNEDCSVLYAYYKPEFLTIRRSTPESKLFFFSFFFGNGANVLGVDIETKNIDNRSLSSALEIPEQLLFNIADQYLSLDLLKAEVRESRSCFAFDSRSTYKNTYYKCVLFSKEETINSPEIQIIDTLKSDIYVVEAFLPY